VAAVGHAEGGGDVQPDHRGEDEGHHQGDDEDDNAPRAEARSIVDVGGRSRRHRAVVLDVVVEHVGGAVEDEVPIGRDLRRMERLDQRLGRGRPVPVDPNVTPDTSVAVPAKRPPG
jgi:hypothetical protein